MLRPRWYKVIHDLFGNKTRTLLIVLSMAVGLFAIGIILSARTILTNGLASSFAAIHPSSGTVRTVELFGEEFLQSVRSMKEVQQADAPEYRRPWFLPRWSADRDREGQTHLRRKVDAIPQR